MGLITSSVTLDKESATDFHIGKSELQLYLHLVIAYYRIIFLPTFRRQQERCLHEMGDPIHTSLLCVFR